MKQTQSDTQSKYSLYRFSLPFKKIINFKGIKLQTRQGLWLIERSNGVITGLGEVCPLPGFSDESLNDAEQQLLQLLKQPSFCIKAALSETHLFASVHWALHCLQKRLPWHKLTLQEEHQLQSIPLLSGANSDELIACYQRKQNPAKAKLKVARLSIPQELQLIDKLITLNPKLRLRLDANQQWQRNQYQTFLSQVNTNNIDYIEEPTASISDNISLAEKHHIAIALDESLLTSPPPQHSIINALIIKPTLIGSVNKITALLKHAQQHNLQVSISSSFESPFAIEQLKQQATIWHKQYGIQISLGLDTLEAFQDNLLGKLSLQQQLKEARCIYQQ